MKTFFKVAKCTIASVIALVLLLFSCSKQLQEPITPIASKAGENQIGNAKTWFEGRQPKVFYLNAGSKAQAKYNVQPDWSNASTINYGNTKYITIPVKIGSQKESIPDVRSMLMQVDDNGNIVQAKILEIISDHKNISKDELNKILFGYEELIPESFSGEIRKFNIGYSPEHFMTCVNGKIIKSRKIVVHEPSQASARMSPCIDWFLETYENGSLVSSIYVGTTCSCETRIAAPNARLASVECAGKGSPSSYTTSPSGSSSSLGDVFLCPNSLRVDHTDVDRRLISTYGVKVGVGSNYMKYGIDAYLPNQINPSNVSWDDDSFELLRIWGKDYDAWAGVDKVGNTYKVSDAALRILVSRASDFATRDYDVNRLGRLNDKPAYREAIINSMTSYLQEYFGQNANMMIELPNLRQTPDTPDAVLTDSWFNYWVGNCR